MLACWVILSQIEFYLYMCVCVFHILFIYTCIDKICIGFINGKCTGLFYNG